MNQAFMAIKVIFRRKAEDVMCVKGPNIKAEGIKWRLKEYLSKIVEVMALFVATHFMSTTNQHQQQQSGEEIHHDSTYKRSSFRQMAGKVINCIARSIANLHIFNVM